MAITFVNQQKISSGGTTNPSGTADGPGTTTNWGVFVTWISGGGFTEQNNDMTYGGVAMTRVGNSILGGNTGAGCVFWGTGATLATGNQTISATSDGSANHVFYLVYYNGLDQVTPVRGFDQTTDNEDGTPITLTTSAFSAGDWLYFGQQQSTGFPSADITDRSGGDQACGDDDNPADGSISWDGTNAGATLVAMAPAGAVAAGGHFLNLLGVGT